MRRHPAVHGSVVAGVDDVGFVPDTDVASARFHAAVDIYPHWPVAVISRSRTGFQLLEGAPVADGGRKPQQELHQISARASANYIDMSGAEPAHFSVILFPFACAEVTPLGPK